MAPIAHGRTGTLRLGKQADFVTPAPASPAYTQLPFYTHSLGLEGPLDDDPVLSRDAVLDPSTPAPGLKNHGGALSVPVDLNQLGHWLRLVFGAPVTTDDTGGDFTHVFKSGAIELPAGTIEMQARSDVVLQHVGCMIDTWAMSTQRQAGYGRADFTIVGRTENRLSAPVDSDAAAVAEARIPAFTGTLKIDDVAAAAVTDANFTYANALAPHEGLDAAGLQTGYDTGMRAFTGQLTARFTDTVLYADAEAASALSLEFLWSLAANKSLSVKAGVARLERARIGVDGPGGIQVPYSFKAETDPDEAAKAMLVVTLKNQVAAY